MCAVVAAACTGTALGADGPRPATPDGAQIVGEPIPGGVALRASDVSFAPGRLLVRFRKGTGPTLRSSALDRAGVERSLASYDLVPGLELVKLAPGTNVPTAALALEGDPSVEYAEPDLRVPVSVIPNDPSFGQQWGLTAIGAPAAWDRTIGSAAVTVGVLDTGIQMNHPDLAANVWTNPDEIAGNSIDDDANGFVDDVHGWDFWNNDNDPSDDLAPQVGHGTHVAGIIGAAGNNATGVAGVNWTVQLLPLKICQNSLCDISNEIAALDYAADKGVNAVNSSFGGPTELQSERDAIQAAGAAGVIDVAAAGNASSDNDVTPAYPASHPLDNIISVAATTNAGDMASFSNFGTSSVDLGAPGQDILEHVPDGRLQHAVGHFDGGSARRRRGGAAVGEEPFVDTAADPHATDLDRPPALRARRQRRELRRTRRLARHRSVPPRPRARRARSARGQARARSRPRRPASLAAQPASLPSAPGQT